MAIKSKPKPKTKPTKIKKIQTKSRWKKWNTSGQSPQPIQQQVVAPPQEVYTPPPIAKRVDEMTFSELNEAFGFPKEYNIFMNPVRNPKAYAMGVWYAKRKKSAKTKKRMPLHLNISCAMCKNYKKPHGFTTPMCIISGAKIKKSQSLRNIDCSFFDPSEDVIKLRKKQNIVKSNKRSEYSYDDTTPICPYCNSYMEYYDGNYYCPNGCDD